MIQTILDSAVLCGALFLVSLAYLLITRIIRKPISSSKTPFTVWMLDLLFWPMGVVTFFAAINALLHSTNIPDVAEQLNTVQSLMMYLAIFTLLARGVDLIILRWYVFHRTGFTTPGLLRGLNYVVFIISGISLFLTNIGHPITGFLVSTGVVAGIFGFALQDTLSDLFSGLALSVDKPFHIGEWIELEDKTVGQVIDVTWRSTRIMTFNSSLLSISNSVMAKSTIHNLDRPNKNYSIWYRMRISADVDPKLVMTVLSTAIGQCRHVLRSPSPTVRLADATTAPYIYTVWVYYRSYLGHFRGQDELHTAINRNLKAAGISPIGELQEVKYSRSSQTKAVSPKISDTLLSMDIFSELEDNEIEQIANGSEYVLVAEDTVLLEENTPSNHVYVVVSGTLEASVDLGGGQRALGEQLSEGDSFGWATIVAYERAIMTVTATSDSLVLLIDAEYLKPVLQEHEELQQRFIRLVTERVTTFSNIRSEVRGKRRPFSPNELRHRIERFIASGSER